MVSFTALFVAVAAALSVSAKPFELNKRITASQTGTNNGFYYSFWTNGGGSVDYENGSGGAYSVNWSNAGDFTAGKGWNPGSAQAITFSGSFNGGSNGYLAVYGWTTGPLVEYYILENFGSYNPGPSMTHKGTVTSDGSSYDIYEHQQVNQPSINGTQTFNQFWSIRSSKRSSGTVTTENHFKAWAGLGMQMGSFNYQIISTEGYQSTGSSSMTVSAGTGSPNTGSSSSSTPTSSSSSTKPTSSSSSAGGGGGTCSAIYGQCGGIGWNGPTCCSSGTCKASNSYYSQCL